MKTIFSKDNFTLNIIDELCKNAVYFALYRMYGETAVLYGISTSLEKLIAEAIYCGSYEKNLFWGAKFDKTTIVIRGIPCIGNIPEKPMPNSFSVLLEKNPLFLVEKLLVKSEYIPNVYTLTAFHGVTPDTLDATVARKEELLCAASDLKELEYHALWELGHLAAERHAWKENATPADIENGLAKNLDESVVFLIEASKLI